MALGGAADEVRERVDLTGVDVVLNPDFGDGCATSIRSALAAVRDDAEASCSCSATSRESPPGRSSALVAGAGGARGRGLRVRRRARPPAVVPSAHVRVLAGLHGDKAVWKLVDAGEDVVRVPVAGRVPRDVDTWADYQALLEAAE